jgi:ABC-type Zn uptake system ZnuABC Zn-binding protein ZnuA
LFPAIALAVVAVVASASWAAAATRTVAAPALADAGRPGDRGLSVVTSSTDLKALVEEVGRERVRVESLTAALQDPHAVDVKPGQLARLRRADLLVRVGLDHEPWLDRALAALGDERLAHGSRHRVDVARGLELLQADTPRIRSERGAHVHGFGNPHVWLDPENARPITARIIEALAALAPADRRRFDASRTEFLARLDARLARWQSAMAPHAGARVVVVHDTWPYFARRFGLVVVAAVEPTPGVPPSPASLQALVARMRDTKVRLLISEPSAPESVVRHVSASSGVPAVTLVPSVGGHADARDYLALFDLNVQRLTEALAARR